MNLTELVMRRRNFQAFVDADPVSVAFVRQPAPTPTAAGGTIRTAPTTLAPQTGRIVPNVRRYDPGLVDAEAGDIPRTRYLLLGAHNMDVAVDDRFSWRDQHYVVRGIHPTREESTLCAIDFEGPSNG